MLSGEQVSLYRCKVCAASLFERDAEGHHRRHVAHGEAEASGWRGFFTRTQRKVYAQAGYVFQVFAKEQGRLRPSIVRARS